MIAISLAGVAAVWFLLFIERLDGKLKRNGKEAKLIFSGRLVIGVVVGLIALVAVAILIAFAASFLP